MGARRGNVRKRFIRRDGSHGQYFGEEGDAGDVGEYLGDDGDIWTGAIQGCQFLGVTLLVLLTSYTPKAKGWGNDESVK